MKRLLPVFLVFFCMLGVPGIASAQAAADTLGQALVAHDILTSLRQVEAFQQLFIRRNALIAQLHDIEQWRQQGKLSPQQLARLRDSYSQIQVHTNQVADLVCRDLRSFRRLRDLQKTNSNPIVANITGSYRSPLLAAGHEYDDKFRPLYETAATGQSSNYKFIPLLPLLLDAAPLIVNALIDLAQGRRSNVNDQLMHVGVGLAVTRLQQKLALDNWSAYVQGSNPLPPSPAAPQLLAGAKTSPAPEAMASTAATDSHSLAPAPVGESYRFLDGGVGLISSASGQSILLTTKLVQVGTQQLPYFETAEGLPTNHRFKVKLTGSEYVAILSYDSEKKSWKQHYPVAQVTKSIGEEEDLQGQVLVLPSPTASFVIKPGTNQQDDFLILVSNTPMNEDALNTIQLQTATGPAILTQVDAVFNRGRVQASWDGAVAGQRLAQVPLKASSATCLVSPIYIDIRKQ
jgi:hypothetical protein